MAQKAVFLDRDNTLIDDPGYLSDPSAVKLLPGVELALKSLHEAGFKLVVVTNQSAVARGLVTEEALGAIHEEMQRQLAQKGAKLDGVYYCPYHPEGTVEQYAKDSDLRKPKPGMLLLAARELGIDLGASWMVGDSPRDIEAGQRAGCRTIRVRLPAGQTPPAAGEDEDVQADFVVRNLVDAAKVIARELTGGTRPGRPRVARQAQPGISLPFMPASSEPPEPQERPAEAPPAEPASEAQAPPATQAETTEPRPSDRVLLEEILQLLRQQKPRPAAGRQEVMLSRVLAGVCLAVSAVGLLIVLIGMLRGDDSAVLRWGVLSILLAVLSGVLYLIRRDGGQSPSRGS